MANSSMEIPLLKEGSVHRPWPRTSSLPVYQNSRWHRRYAKSVTQAEPIARFASQVLAKHGSDTHSFADRLFRKLSVCPKE